MMHSPLFGSHHQLGATFIERDGATIPRDFGDARAEYAALREDAGVIDLTHFGILRVEGRDRVKWLHNLLTTDVEALADGAGALGLLLEAKGHVVADYVLLREPEAFWLYSSPRAIQNLSADLRRAIFREKVTLADVSDQFALLSLQGARAKVFAGKLVGILPPLKEFQFTQTLISKLQSLLIRNPRADADGYDFLLPRENVVTAWDALIAIGARPVGFDALNVARVEEGSAWYGDDYDETTLAPEARLEKFIAPDKGCYPGQEVIARIRNLGHVNRLLTQFRIEGTHVPERGDLVMADGREVGSITSSVWSFANNAPLALGYLRRELAEQGASVEIASKQNPDAPRMIAAVILPKSKI